MIISELPKEYHNRDWTEKNDISSGSKILNCRFGFDYEEKGILSDVIYVKLLCYKSNPFQEKYVSFSAYVGFEERELSLVGTYEAPGLERFTLDEVKTKALSEIRNFLVDVEIVKEKYYRIYQVGNIQIGKELVIGG
jgi:hypothetical protein